MTEEKIPATLTQAVNRLYDAMTETERKGLAENGSAGYHFGTGMAIRNTWGLWRGGPLKEFFMKTYGLGHADDMSGMILSGLEARCKGERIDYDAEAEHYRQYWLKMGVDPLTQQEISM